MAERVSAADFWQLLLTSRLLNDEDLTAIRAKFAGRTDATDAVAIATRLSAKGVLTAWQARQLLKGRSGPFFLGDYRLLEQQKTPFAGRVFVARHEPTRRDVTLVVLDSDACDTAATWDGIVQATQRATSVTDPVVSKTWALEQAGRRRLIVCETVAGAPLIERFSKVGSLPLTEAGRLVFAVTRAVAEMHRLGIVHGAISLHTLIKTDSTSAAGSDTAPVRLLQFPLAGDPHVHPPRLPLDDQKQLEALGQRICFAAPELATPGSTATATSDVYALGGVLAALLTGQLPNWDGTVAGTLARTQASGLTLIPTHTLPAEVATAIEYMTARDPLDRYASAVEAAAAVAACFGFPEFSTEPQATAPVATEEASPPVIAREATTVSTATRRRRRATAARSHRWQTIAFGLLAVVLAAAGVSGIWWALGGGGGEPPVVDTASDDNNDLPAEGPDAVADSDDAEAGRPQTLVDDTTLPWASPTTGVPPSLAYLPQGSQLILLARLAELQADDEGRRFVHALGPEVEALLVQAQAFSGLKRADIAELRIGWGTTADGQPTVGAVLVATAPPPEEGSWTRGTPREEGGETVREAGGVTAWMPHAAEGRVLVVGSPAAIDASIAAEGMPLVPPDAERLVAALDTRRQLTLIASPSFLRNDGQLFLPKQLTPPAMAVADLLSESTTFAALSMFLGETCYVEIAAVPTTTEPPRRLVDEMAKRLEQLPDDVEPRCLALASGVYGGRLIGRLPGMLRVVAAELRWGVEDGLAVLNAHLPREAAHNITLASELALAQEPGAAAAVAVVAATPDQPRTVNEKLAQTVSLVFAKDTLEKSIEMLSGESGIPMEILGSDLQLEGITKNQSFGLDQQEQSVDTILRTILAKANPDGKLVYVIRGEGETASLVITTKAAVAKRGESLPPGFEEP